MHSQVGKSGLVRRETLTRAAIFDRSLPADLIERLWREPASLIQSGDMMRRTGLRRTVRLDWNSKPYVLKQYRPTWWHFVRQLPLRSWASATFKSTIRLLNAGFPTPRPVACVENRWGSLRRDSFLMYEYVEGVTLRSYLKDKAEHPRPLTENLSRQIRDLWQRLADLRASLDDSHTGNFIVCPAGRLWVIDLDNTRFHRTMFMAARQQARNWEQFLRSAAKCGTPNVMRLRIRKRSKV
jgi:lipopolysaccharide kinase (Kdo/WaaP) family protein